MSLVSPVKVWNASRGVPVSGTSVTLPEGQPVTLLSFSCTRYAVLPLPPSLVWLQVTVSFVSPGPADTLVGGSGGPTGVPFSVDDHAPWPTLFTATTRTVYSTPLVNPVMVWVRVVGVACREGSKSWLPDFHCTT